MKIVIVDDDILVSTSLKTIIESNSNISVLGVGNSGLEAIKLYKIYKPDILLMDIQMNGMTGIEAAAEIINFDCNAKILFLTTFSDDEYIINALKIGAKGYILKQHFESIIPSLSAIYNGQNVFGNEIVSKLPNMLDKSNKKSYTEFGLCEKENDIINLVAKGLSNKEISKELFLSEGTVRNYISTILDKLTLRDRTQLAIFYYNNLLN
ncbi:response regulator transcription factor [Sedimentibacter sp. zth1]|uniref:response regulator transcription factor n=1 Tax=Sedimentibacter sp. zth1 TaxID=2816908 RepID=UPI001A93966D|nr:response regulator transcription factor [Sedimentibacter sp. zth1]QSX05209.1 response regulator transcription factor [Sedimentibacter sp. zth1]